jgi:hypothetical protein
MLKIRLVKTVIAVGPTGDESQCAEFAKLIVNSVNIESAYKGKLTHIPLLTRPSKERPK